MNYDIVIIGASFAGLALAHHLPKDLKVLMLDKKNSLDAYVESTGLITSATKALFEEFIDVREYIPNAITTICVVAPDYQKHFFSHTEKPWIYSTDTPRLVRAVSEIVPKNVELWIGATFLDYTREKDSNYPLTIRYAQNGDRHEVHARFIVGADGAESKVARTNPALSQNRRFLSAVEKVFYGDILLGSHPDHTVYHFWFGEFSLGYGGWLSPTIINGKKAFRLGIAKLQEDAKGLHKVNEFIDILQTRQIIRIQEHDKPLLTFGSHVPIGGVLKGLYDNHSLLIGDAAGFCGAFAADGIKGALVSGKVAAKIIPRHLDGDQKALPGFIAEMEQHNHLIRYYKKQVLYRLAWDRMRTNRSFELLYELINRQKDHFLDQFCDSKETKKSLLRIILRIENIPLLIKYTWSIFLDMFKK